MRRAHRRHRFSFTNNISLVVWNIRGQDCSCRFICHLCRNVSIAFAERCPHAILQLRTLCWLAVRSCSIACEHLSAKAILTFLHRWQMNLHEQSWPRTFHTTKEILFVKLKRWRRWARLTAPRWLTLRGSNLLWSMSIHRQTNCAQKRRLRKSPWLEQYSYLLKSWISLFWYPVTLR